MPPTRLLLALLLSTLLPLASGCASADPAACDDDDLPDDDDTGDDDTGDDDTGDDDTGDDDDTTEPAPNLPPSPPQIELSPPDATAIDPLSCQIGGPGEDPEGAPLYYRFRWEVDGVEVVNETSTLQQEQTSTGETWTCIVTSFDGVSESEPVSASVTIGAGNELPSAPDITIEPAFPTPEDELSCVIVVPSVDPEGDTISYDFVWSQNGADVVFDQSIVPAAQTDAGDLWGCRVTPLTDFGPGNAGTATVTIGS